MDPKDPPHNLMLIRVHENMDETSLTGGADTIDAIRGAVREVAKDFPQFKVGLTGRPVLDADENRTTDRDGRKSEIVALSVVFIGLVLFLRSVWLAVVAEVSLAIAIGWTFGWATLSVHRLNLLSTVFLIALIGIGMDYLIQILAAYRREARRYVRPQAIWARVFRYVGPPVNTACMGAAGAFLVSALTDFKGAAELGIIAGGGLLLCGGNRRNADCGCCWPHIAVDAQLRRSLCDCRERIPGRTARRAPACATVAAGAD